MSMSTNPRLSALTVFLAATFSAVTAIAVADHGGGEIEAMTMDGQRVLLKSDHSWEPIVIPQGDPSTSAILTVTNVREMHEACGMQLRIQNNLGYKIRSLVPRFFVYNRQGILFDERSQSFSSIKPTKDQYKEIQFSGIGCYEISTIKVQEAHRCTMGDIDIHNEEEGECLALIYVEPSTLINISK
ncbi:MAG: hypothetical protein AAGA91_02530 [Pseudomonadota bacterium]